MSETHKGILDREYANEAAKHFQESLALISDLLDYGTFLVPRAFVSSPRDLKATCLIFVQLRQFLVHLDGTTIPVSYTHLRAHETRHDLVCRLLLEKKK